VQGQHKHFNVAFLLSESEASRFVIIIVSNFKILRNSWKTGRIQDRLRGPGVTSIDTIKINYYAPANGIISYKGNYV
jgi:hypothetical protein